MTSPQRYEELADALVRYRGEDEAAAGLRRLAKLERLFGRACEALAAIEVWHDHHGKCGWCAQLAYSEGEAVEVGEDALAALLALADAMSEALERRP